MLLNARDTKPGFGSENRTTTTKVKTGERQGQPLPPSLSIRSCLVLYCLVSSCLVWPCLVLSCLVLSCLALPCLVLSCLVLSCLVSSCLVLSCLVLPCLVLPCLVLSCLVLFCLALSCLVLSCLVSQSPLLIYHQPASVSRLGILAAVPKSISLIAACVPIPTLFGLRSR